MKLVEHAMTVENAGTSGESPASKISSRAMLETVGSGMTCPQMTKSGAARTFIAFITGTDSAMALCFANAPPALTNGVRNPGTRNASAMAMSPWSGQLKQKNDRAGRGYSLILLVD